MTSTEYVNMKQQEALKYIDAWEIQLNHLEKEEKENLLALLNEQFPSFNEDLVNGVLDPINDNQVLENFAKSLYNDIDYYTNRNYQKLYNLTDLGFIRRGSLEAGCISVDDYNKPFDNKGYAILINIGLYYAINLLVKGIIVENLQNEWEKYKQDPIPFLNNALEIYLHHNDKVIENMKFDEFPIEIAKVLNYVQSNSTVRLMQFIALHEFGHVVHGDLGIMSLYHDGFMGKEINSTNDVYKKEFLADKFAIECLLAKDSNMQSNWGSFYTIAFFLAWISGVEKILNTKISTVHPDPIDRIWNLYNFMVETHEDKYNYKDLIITPPPNNLKHQAA